VAEWIYFLHPPRDDFAVSMSDEERAVFAEHRAYLEELLAQGSLILAGPTGGIVNTGIAVLETPDEASARAIMDADPVIVAGIMRGELRAFRATFLRGRS
jgi:uncharacterized protein YciI